MDLLSANKEILKLRLQDITGRPISSVTPYQFGQNSASFVIAETFVPEAKFYYGTVNINFQRDAAKASAVELKMRDLKSTNGQLSFKINNAIGTADRIVSLNEMIFDTVSLTEPTIIAFSFVGYMVNYGGANC